MKIPMKNAVRRKMACAFGAAVVCLLAAGVLVGAAEDSHMRAKLTHAQDILEGITLKDYGKIKDGAIALRAISVLDEWMRMEGADPDFQRYSQNFREIVDGLEKAADDKNIHSATFRYSQMTFSCVQCHEHLRDKK